MFVGAGFGESPNQPGWLTLLFPNLILNNLSKKSAPQSGVNKHLKNGAFIALANHAHKTKSCFAGSSNVGFLIVIYFVYNRQFSRNCRIATRAISFSWSKSKDSIFTSSACKPNDINTNLERSILGDSLLKFFVVRKSDQEMPRWTIFKQFLFALKK